MSKDDAALTEDAAARATSDVHSDECLALLASFMRGRDRKARAEIVRFAQRCAYFEPGGIVSFGFEATRD
ncbi:hypothetical protein [Bradyrhizobium sp. CCBAU 53421]|uniref:hypothetical protein n=1 Tax=Bradyrhizobium sp. CCBAU 53421 TaxID=1325120 RepID=UPI00188B1130|nr:hypothetical protein [Bradyrhizobium sp. CCBAU 53421]QOZ32343.1 hypothetical protein XH92_12060 [Bradyrhizobium sp. CCBAU 53421]